MLDLRRLRLLRELARRGTITAVAQALSYKPVRGLPAAHHAGEGDRVAPPRAQPAAEAGSPPKPTSSSRTPSLLEEMARVLLKLEEQHAKLRIEVRELEPEIAPISPYKCRWNDAETSNRKIVDLAEDHPVRRQCGVVRRRATPAE